MYNAINKNKSTLESKQKLEITFKLIIRFIRCRKSEELIFFFILFWLLIQNARNYNFCAFRVFFPKKKKDKIFSKKGPKDKLLF